MYWKSIIINMKGFIYRVLQTLHEETSVNGEAGKNSSLGTETQCEIEYGLFEM